MMFFPFQKRSPQKAFTAKNVHSKKRSLQLETLEEREFLSVTPLTPELFVSQAAVEAEAAPVYPAPTVEDKTATGLTLTWDISDYDHLRIDEPFKIEKASVVNDTKTWTQFGNDIPYSYTPGKTEYSYAVTGLTASTEYEFRISFGSTVLGKAYSESVTVTTLRSELKAEPLSSTSVQLSWSIAARSGTYFSLQKKDGANWTEVGKYKVDSTAASARTYTVEDLEAGTDYEFKLVYYQPSSTGAQTESQSTTVKTLSTLTVGHSETTSVELTYPAAMPGTGRVVQICNGTADSTVESNWKNAKVDSATVVANGFKVIGLKENSSYYFRVQYDTVENGVTKTNFTDVLSYSSPTSIKTSDATNNSAKVTWTFDNRTGTAHYVEISKTGNGSDWTDHPGANTTGKSVTLTNLEAGTTYYVRVRYTSKSGIVSWSADAELETGVTTVLDGVTSSSATLSWSIPNLGTGTAVAVQRCEGSLDPAADSNWRTVESHCTASSFTSSHLASNKKYYFRVQYTLAGETKHTIYVEALTTGTLTAGDTTIDTVKLDWNFVPKASSTITVQCYEGVSAPTSEAAWGTLPQPITEADLDEDRKGCTVKGLTPGKKYYFRVLYTPEGSSIQQKSTVASATTLGSIFVTTNVQDTSITVHWAATGFGDKKKDKDYVVYYYENSERTGAKEWKSTAAIDAAQNQYTFSGLIADTEYQFKIAYVGDAQSDAVNTSPLVVTTKPHGIEYTSTKDSVRLEWTFSTFQHAAVNELETGDGEGKFIVQRYDGSGEPTVHDASAGWTNVGTTTNSETKYYNITDLTPNSTRYYRVIYTYSTGPAEEGSGNDWVFPLETKYSDILKTVTQSDIRLTAAYPNTIRLTWDAQTLNAETQYTVQKRLAGQTAWTDAGQTASTTYDVNGLTANTDYEFRVLYNGVQNTATLSASTEKYVLSVISKTINVSAAAANVQMTYLPDAESNFKLYYRVQTEDGTDWTGSESSVAGSVDSAKKSVSFDLSTLLPETEYEFKAVYTLQGVNKESEVRTVELTDDLTPSSVAATSASIRWNESSFPDKKPASLYRVQWREAGAAEWTSASSGTSATSYTVSGLVPNKDYEIRVEYYTNGDITAYSAVKTLKTGQPLISATAPQVGKVQIAWTIESVSGYTVEYKGLDGDWHTAQTVSVNTSRNTTIDKIDTLPLESETEYTFRIKYRNSQTPNGEYVYSEEAVVTTRMGFQADDSVVSTNSIKVKWDYTTDSTFKIEYRESGAQSWIRSGTDIESAGTEHLIEGLYPGVKYEIRLTYSEGYEQEVTINAATAELAPQAPTGVSVTGITPNEGTVNWTDNSEYEAKYVIKWTNNVTGISDTAEIAFGIGTGTMSYELTGLDTKVSYTVEVYAKNDKGSSASATATFTTQDILRPAAVTTVKAVTTPKSITLSWKIKSVDGVTDPDKFRIEYYEETDKLWYEVQNVNIVYDTETLTYSLTLSNFFTCGDSEGGTTDITLQDKKSYQFRIVALAPPNDGDTVFGNATPAAIKATTSAMVVPSSLRAINIKMTSATVTFADTDRNVPSEEKTYTVHYAAGAKRYTNWADVPEADIVSLQVPAGQKTVDLKKLQTKTIYTYIVESAYLGETVSTKPASFTTSDVLRPAAVTTVKAAATPKSITLSWKIRRVNGVTDPDKFRIEYCGETDKLWYEVQNVNIFYDTKTLTYSLTLSNSFTYGDSEGGTADITLQEKRSYQFRIIALAPPNDGDTIFGNATPTAIKATTSAMVVPSSLRAGSIKMTSATVTFTDTDKNVPSEEKTYTVRYAAGAKRYTNWADVPEADIVSAQVPAGQKTINLTELQAGKVYTYIVESAYLGETVSTKPASFTTSKPPTASTIKGGFTLTEDNAYAFRISWKAPTAATIPAGMSLSYVIELSTTGREGSFVAVPASMVAFSSGVSGRTALEYGVMKFSEAGKLLAAHSLDITSTTSLSVRIGTVFSENGNEAGTSWSTKGTLRLPKFV